MRTCPGTASLMSRSGVLIIFSAVFTCSFFFFQAEDGIRDLTVTGVQTYALPILTTPRYQDVLARDIPEVVDDDGTRVRVVCGEFWGQRGPVEGVAADPRYLDVSVDRKSVV